MKKTNIFQNDEKEKRAAELVILETKAIAQELQQFIQTANAPIFGIDAQGNVNEWNQTAAKITGSSKEEVLANNLVETYITENFRPAVKHVLDNALVGEGGRTTTN